MYWLKNLIVVETKDGIKYEFDTDVTCETFKTISDFNEHFNNVVMPLTYINSSALDDLKLLINDKYVYNNTNDLCELIDICKYLGATQIIYQKIINVICKLFSAELTISLLDLLNLFNNSKINEKKKLLEVVIDICDLRQLNNSDMNGWTPLLVACHWQINVVELLILRGVDINHKNIDKSTALMIAASDGNMQAVNILLTSGADIHIQDNEGKNALMLAVENENIEIIEILLHSGTNINTQDFNGNTALMLAIFQRNTNISKLLINKGTNINLLDDSGNSALMFAIEYDLEDVVEILLNKGANPYLSGGNIDAIKLAHMGESKKIKQLLLNFIHKR